MRAWDVPDHATQRIAMIGLEWRAVVMGGQEKIVG
jgi:hypothetical protein